MSADVKDMLHCFTDVELLNELIKRNGLHQGPTKTTYAGTIREAVIGIGNDHTADIRLHVEDYEALQEIAQQDSMK